MPAGDAAADDAEAEEAGSDEHTATRSPAQYAHLLEALDAGVFVVDAEGVCTFVNDELCALSGYSREEILGAGPRLAVDDETVADIEQAIVRRLKETTDPFTVGRRIVVQRSDGEQVPCRAHMTVLRGDGGENLGTVGLVRDVSARERRESRLGGLQEITQSLMQAPSRGSVAEIVADAAVERLGFDTCVVRLYDADDRTLVPVAHTGTGERDAANLPRIGLEGSPPAEVFTTGEPAVYDDVADVERSAEDATIVRTFERTDVNAVAYLPIGVHGTLAVGATDSGTFDDVDGRIAGLLATNAAAACNRAKREREVMNARQHVATIVERIEGLVADTIEVLVGARTREELERDVCERLATTDPYAAAWLVRPDVRESTLEPTEQAGCEPLAVADSRIDLDGDAPGAVAYRKASTQIVDEATLSGAETGWLARAHDHGVAAAVAIPLAHHRASYGVVYVCADRPDAFDERELVVLEALGRAIANAIDAIESGRILETDEVVELSVAVEDGTLLDRAAAPTGATLSTAGTMSDDGGTLRLFLTATGGDPAVVETALANDDAVTAVSLVADLDGEALFDITLADSLLADLVARGVVPTHVATEGNGTRLTVEVPDGRAARETFAFVETHAEGVRLVGYREHERPVRTRQEFRASLAERFTGRQETALRTAYHGGFFDWPRGADGDELADSMDISRPTYHQHLRAAQRKVFEELFETESQLRD